MCSDWLLKLGIASAIHLQAKSVIFAQKLKSFTGINGLKIIIFVLYDVSHYLSIIILKQLFTSLSVASGRYFPRCFAA